MYPFSAEQWQAIDALGHHIDHHLHQDGVGLTMGGEPTYVSATDRTDLQWRYGALGEDKRRLAGQLLGRLQTHLAPAGSLRLHALGKVYPGEGIPRWALSCFWRGDGEPLWHSLAWFAKEEVSYGHTWRQGASFVTELRRCLGISPGTVLTAVEPESTTPQGYILPLLTVAGAEAGDYHWTSCHWQPWSQAGAVQLIPGHGPMGIRLPLGDLPEASEWCQEATPTLETAPIRPGPVAPLAPENSIRVALCVEVREETIHVFLPPIASARSFVDVVTAVEATAESLDLPIILEGYPPPLRQGIQGFQITPDPGVIEVNIHPARSWPELVTIHHTLDREALACGLDWERYGLDGRFLGTGGGSHITIGGDRWEQSPLLRRPDLLRSLITYWQHHPSLTYLFAGEYIGPTSQAPRADEARHDGLYELEIAFLSLAPRTAVPPEVVDRLLRPLLVDVTGNTHRAALCVDKLFPVDNPALQLGLLEFRSFEMPPSTGLRLLQMLLVRGLVALFWRQPYTQPLRRWQGALGDRLLLPHYLAQDWQQVLQDLNAGGYGFQEEWFAPFWHWRLPCYGRVSLGNNPMRQLELRAALEAWPVIGDSSSGRTSRPVDNSLDRLQIRLTGAIGEAPHEDRLSGRYQVLCNGVPIPLRSTGRVGEYVGGVRFRARPAAPGEHFAIAPQAPLSFQVVDTWKHLSLGGAQYRVNAPDGTPYSEFPLTATMAQARFAERIAPLPPCPWPGKIPPLALHPDSPYTLDLRLWYSRLSNPHQILEQTTSVPGTLTGTVGNFP